MEKVKDIEQARAKKNEMEVGKPKKKGSAKKVIAIIVVILALGLVGYAAWFINSLNYVAFSSAAVSGTTANIGAKSAGKVAEVKVAVGDTVKKGDVLFTMETDLAQLQLNQAEAALNIANLQLEKVKAGARPEELTGAKSLVDQASASYMSTKQSRDNLSASLKDLKAKRSKLITSLAKFKNSNGDYDASATYAALDAQRAAGTITDAQYTFKVQSISSLIGSKTQLDSQISQMEDQLKVLNLQLAASKAGVTGANSKVDMAKAGATSYDISVLENQVKVSEANYAMAKMNLDNAQVKSTIDGTVIKVGIVSGDIAAPGTGGISVVDFSKLTINANVDETKADEIKLGQEASFQVSAFPGVKFVGKVKEIGLATLLTLDPYSTNGTTGSSNNDNQVVPIKIEFSNQGKNIKPGFTVDGKIKVK